MGKNNLLRQIHGSRNPLPFLKCANETLLPLTLRGPSVTMPPRENFSHSARGRNRLMAGRIVMPPMSEEENRAVLPLSVVRGLLDTMEKPLIVAERSGNLLLINTRGKQFLESHGYAITPGLNLFKDFLQVDAGKIFSEIA